MGNSGSASRHEQAKSSSQKRELSAVVSAPAGERNGYGKRGSRSKRLTAEAAATGAAGNEDQSANAGTTQRLRQASTWSFGSLSGRLNWSFTGGATKSSFHNRNKASRKSLTSVQQRRSKTQWHKPLMNAIFSSHFKETSRNDQFHIEHLIAKGAFGVVFKVSNKLYQRELQQCGKSKQQITKTSDKFPAPVYALKVLRKSKIIEENSVQQIKDEADIQKLCGHHPFIVQQVDSWQNRRNLHILSEYVPNGELFSKFTEFSVDLIRVYLAEIALAIDFLHNAGVIYRDVKPENILLTENFHLKLTDFGLSKWLKLGATTKTMCGTFQYMAPEILRGELYTHAVDWWSMGILVCQMLTQKSPDIKQFLDIVLPNMPQKDSVDNVVNKFPELPASKKDIDLESQSFLPVEVEELPHEAQDVLKRLLIVDAKQRLRSVLALQKIALYKNFKIDSKHLLSMCPLDIIRNDNIAIIEEKSQNGISDAETFQYF